MPASRNTAARTEAREANKGGISGIGKGLTSAADQNDAALTSAFAKHNSKSDHQTDGHVPGGGLGAKPTVKGG